jgi:shikimate kinase
MHIVLLGLRASGKSTIGRRLADKVRRFFIDLDDVTAIELGTATAGEGLSTFGEPAFRAAEVRALTKALAKPPRVIALGGGTPTAPGAREMLAARRADGTAFLIYLRAEAETLKNRLRATDLATRPALTDADPLSEVDVLLERRDAMYSALADEVIEVDELTTDEVLARVHSLVRSAE